MKLHFIVNNCLSAEVNRWWGEDITKRDIIEKNKISYTVKYRGKSDDYFINRFLKGKVNYEK